MTKEEKKQEKKKEQAEKRAIAMANRDRRAATAGRPERAFFYSQYFGLFSLFVLFLYAIGEAGGKGYGKLANFFDILGIVLALAFCSFAVGGIIGFLFGIPHAAQPAGQGAATATPSGNAASGSSGAGSATGSVAAQAAAPPPANNNPPPRYDYAPSTNLEQIADWLTKIMVGVGLTQIHKIIVLFNQLCVALGKALENHLENVNQGAPIAGVILILFSILGFLIVYLWTYLYMIGIQRNLICGIMDAIRGQIKSTDASDKKAYDLANLQLNKPKLEADTPVSELVEAFRNASGSTVSEIFFLAVEHRKQNLTPEQKYRIDKIIPVLQALAKLDPAVNHPENAAELGYVLMNKETPDYVGALKYFDQAVSGYTEENKSINKSMLYICRAYCKIKTNPADKASIKADLDAAKTGGTAGYTMPAGDTTIADWQTSNA